MGYTNGEEIEMGIRFRNPKIEVTPPQRNLRYVECVGVTRGYPYTMKMKKVRMEDVGKSMKKTDVPPVLGNWDNMNLWIRNMWEALYNPVKLLNHKERRWAVMDGCHRIRLLDAMDADTIWIYEFDYEYEIGRWRVAMSDIPTEAKIIMGFNDRSPVLGTVGGKCIHCGENTSWTRKAANKNTRLVQEIQFCKRCGGENPYPYPGRL